MRLDFIFLMLSFSVVQHFMLMFLCNHHVGVVICLELFKVTLDAGPSKLIFYEIRVKESWEVSVQLRPMSFERTL